MKFCYLKRERYGAKQKLMWLAYDAKTGKELNPCGPWRLKQEADGGGLLCRGYTILPEGMTPEQYVELQAYAKRRPFSWRNDLQLCWATGRDEHIPWMRQLRNTLGLKGLAKFKF